MPFPLILLMSVLFAGEDAPKTVVPTATKLGKVVTLAQALAPLGLTFDKEPVAKQMVLLEADGTITPLLSDDASRAFFLDDRVRDRKVEIKGRLFKGSPYFQVVTFKIEDGGRLRTPEYYCEICSISVRYPQDCPCCQGALIYRMKPDEP